MLSTVAVLPLLWLMFLPSDTLAVAPGDEYDGCEVPDYPVNVKVLMDSWRYQTLLAQNDINTTTAATAVWNTQNFDMSHQSAVSQNNEVGGVCIALFLVLIIDSVVFYWRRV